MELTEVYYRVRALKPELAVPGTPPDARFVGGVGDPEQPRFVIIGEAPGAEEDRLGAPFVGASGRLLDEALRAAGLARSDVWITNVVKWRPPANATPDERVIKANKPWLSEELKALGCRRIITLGATPYKASKLRERGVSYAAARERWTEVDGWWFHAMFHPAYVLRGAITKDAYFQSFRTMVLEAHQAVA